MKRIISVLAVMGLMAAMLAATAMPAFADNVKFPGEDGPPILSGAFEKVKGGGGRCPL